MKQEDGVCTSRSDEDSSVEGRENKRKREVYSPQKPRRLRMLERDESFLLVPGKCNRVFVSAQLTVEPIVDLNYYMAHIEDKLAVEVEAVYPQPATKNNNQQVLKETKAIGNQIEEMDYHTGKNHQPSPKKQIIGKDGSSSEKKFRRIKLFDGSSSSEEGTKNVEKSPQAVDNMGKKEEHSQKHHSNDQVNLEKSICKEKDESQHSLKNDQNKQNQTSKKSICASSSSDSVSGCIKAAEFERSRWEFSNATKEDDKSLTYAGG